MRTRIFSLPPLVEVSAVLVLALAGCRPSGPEAFQGYLEGDYLHLGAPVGGILQERPPRRGDTIRAGDVLFRLERASEEAALSETEHRLAQAEARLANLRKGARATELSALSARTNQAWAQLDLWTRELARRERLARESVIASTELDLVRSQRDAAQAALDLAIADLATARLGGRPDDIAAVEAELRALGSARERARWLVDQKTQRAPVGGTVHDTLFRPGEYVPPGQPVLSLLPPDQLKARFFVPEPRVSEFAVGTPVEVRVDGVADAVAAKVSHVSTRPEFTPPVIYSRETRAKLVYMIEADLPPEAAARLHPGQPVEVRRP